MTTLDNRPNTALVVIDMQNGVVADAFERAAVVDNINSLVARARTEQVPVIWVQHSSDELPDGSANWELIPELAPADTEPLVAKQHGDAFEATTLEAELAERGIGRLVVTGAQTDACVRSTLHGAIVRGYDTVLVSDAHTTEDLSEWGAPPVDQVVAHTNLYWSFQTAPGRTAEVLPAADVSFSAPTAD